MHGVVIGAFLGVWQGMCSLTPPYNGMREIPMRFTLSARAPAELDYVIEYVGLEPPRRYILRDARQECPGCYDLDEQNGIVLREVLSADGLSLSSNFPVPNQRKNPNVIETLWQITHPSRLRVSMITRRTSRGRVIAEQICSLQKL